MKSPHCSSFVNYVILTFLLPTQDDDFYLSVAGMEVAHPLPCISSLKMIRVLVERKSLEKGNHFYLSWVM